MDTFSNFAEGMDSPQHDAFAVTPSDTVALPYTTRGLYVGTAGNVAVVMAGGQTVTFVGVPTGTLLPIRVSQVMATGTSALNMLGLY